MPRAVLHPPVEQPENVMALVKPLSERFSCHLLCKLRRQKSEMSLQFWDMGISYAENIGLSFYNCYTKAG